MPATPARFARLFYSMLEGGFQGGKLKLVTRFEKTFRLDAYAVDEERVAHFAKDEIDGELRQRKDPRPIQNLAESLREFLVRYRIRARNVHGPAKIFILDREIDNADCVIERYPAHPLLAASDNAADTELERRKHSSQRPAIFQQDDARPQKDRTDPGVFGSTRLRLPVL